LPAAQDHGDIATAVSIPVPDDIAASVVLERGGVVVVRAAHIASEARIDPSLPVAIAPEAWLATRAASGAGGLRQREAAECQRADGRCCHEERREVLTNEHAQSPF